MPLKPQADRAAARIPTQEEPKEESEETGRSEPEWIEVVLSLAEPAAPEWRPVASAARQEMVQRVRECLTGLSVRV